jgi:6-phosphogluconolactonase (cycloisomerase 2 family)
MKLNVRRTLAAAVIGSALAVVPTALAGAQSVAGSGQAGSDSTSPTQYPAVFVQTDNPSGNQVVVLDQHVDGRLSERAVVSTGGLGGQSQGAVVDQLASQNSLVYDSEQHLLFAVNAGSNTLSVFSAHGRDLRLLQVVPTGGVFPDSVAVSGNLVYVLNAGNTGTVTGYRIVNHGLVAMAGASRSLHLSNTDPPNFLTSPGDIGFSPDGSELIVTTKGSTSSLEVFKVNPHGMLTGRPTVTADPGNVPFSFAFTPSSQLVVAEAGNSTVHTFALGAHGALTSLSASVPDGQTALCWITPVGAYFYVANAGSGTVSAYTVAPDGTPALVGTNGIVASTDAGPIDMAASADGSTLYVEAGGAGAVDELHVGAGGALTDLGNVAGLGTGIEGIATD